MTITSTELAGLVERLRAYADANPQTLWRSKCEAEAADLIEALRQEVQDLTDELAYHGVYPK